MRENIRSDVFAVIKKWLHDESGATAIEYGLMAALIAMALVSGAGCLGGAIDKQFNDAAEALNDAGS